MLMNEPLVIESEEALRRYIEKDINPVLGVKVRRRLVITKMGLTEVRQRAIIQLPPVDGRAVLRSPV